jgi:hypothetical protein
MRSLGKGVLFGCGAILALGLVVGVIVAVISAGMSGEGGEEASGPGSSQENAVPLGETAEIGNVSWQVTNVEQTSQISSALETLEGNFVILDITFTNNSDETVQLDSGSLAIVDGQGRVSEGSEDASLTLDPDLTLFLNEVNPGVTEEARVAFDVAPDAQNMVLRANDAAPLSENYTYIDLGI